MSHCTDFSWKPKTVEESIDAGVHPAVAAMRKKAAEGGRTINDAIVGRRVCHVIGQMKAPAMDMDKLGSDPTYNPMNFFKQAHGHGVNPLRDVMNAGKEGPDIPESRSLQAKKSKKSKKEDKKKKKDKKSKNKKSKKKKKDKSSSSSSSSACEGAVSVSSGSSSSSAVKKKKQKK